MSTINDSEIFKKLKKPALLAFLAVIGYCSYLIYQNLSTKQNDRFGMFEEAILPDLTASIIIAFFVTVFWDAISNYEKRKEKDELLKEFRSQLNNFWETTGKNERELFEKDLLKGVQNIAEGLSKDSASKVFERAARYINDCSEIRVIGTIKENKGGKKFESEGARICIEATENRIARNKDLVYRRITALNLKTIFKEHLQRCFTLKAENSDMGLIFLEHFSPAFSYLIIDDKFIMVSLTYDDHQIQEVCLYSETNEQGLISEFKRHFNAIWEEETEKRRNAVITEIDEFNHIYRIQSEAETYIMNLKKRINEFRPEDSLFQKQALKDLELFSKKYKYEEETTIRHSTANENLIQIFINYLGFLEAGDTYLTITFCGFWSNLIAKKSCSTVLSAQTITR